jgi:arginine decarboxylase
MAVLTEEWTVADASELYNVQAWGQGYFSINEVGHVCVHPEAIEQRSIDLKHLVDMLQLRNVRLPMLVRFNGILKHRIEKLHGVFAKAIREHGYRGDYSCVYPIKVNQQRYVVEQILEHGSQYGFGLEAGSKPELLAAASIASNDTLIVCNGFKDEEFIELAMLFQKIGRRIVPIVERYSELELIIDQAKKLGVRPSIGMRIKLMAPGAGRWQASGGFRSKFGLTADEILCGLEELKGHDMAQCINLLHFHVGSQITDIRRLKRALDEVTRVYADLIKAGADIKYLDVGGGLGVDYDGSQKNVTSSMNYTIEEYAADVVYRIQTVCDDADVPHPHIISESGRALVAYHSVLVMEVLGVSQQYVPEAVPTQLSDEVAQPIHDLLMGYQEVNEANLLEGLHDSEQALENAMNLFSAGYLPLEERRLAEQLYIAMCGKIHDLVRGLDEVPDEVRRLDAVLSDTYFCNFSLFRSLPDSWATDQLFPLLPIHRLDERPTQGAVLADITCDSDGRIDRFVNRHEVRRSLPLHRFNGRPYYLGAFLVGAYQEILGDLHNLFGDTHAVHIDLADDGQVLVQTIVRGKTISQVLEDVQYDDSDLVHRFVSAVEGAVRSGRIDERQAGEYLRTYEDALNRYTYMKPRGLSAR